MAKKTSKIGAVLLGCVCCLAAFGVGARFLKKDGESPTELPTVLTVSVQAGETLAFTDGAIEGVSAIHWGDGFVNQETSHTFAEAGTYRIKLYDVETLGNGRDRLYNSSRNPILCYIMEIEENNVLLVTDTSLLFEGLIVDFSTDDDEVIPEVAERHILSIDSANTRITMSGTSLMDQIPTGGAVYAHNASDSWTLGLLDIEFGSEVENVAKSALDDYQLLTGYGINK